MGTLNWADGEDGTKTFNVTIANDGDDETNETVSLHLASPTGGAGLGNPSNATMTIVDDDIASPTGTVEFTNTAFEVAETSPQATVSVRRSGGSQGAASVEYDTANGSATAGQDYTAVGGTLNWANGDGADKSFDIPILDDIDSEAAETLSIALSQTHRRHVGGSGYRHAHHPRQRERAALHRRRFPGLPTRPLPGDHPLGAAQQRGRRRRARPQVDGLGCFVRVLRGRQRGGRAQDEGRLRLASGPSAP